VALERKSAFIEFARERFSGLNAGRFVVNEDYFSVDHDSHACPLHNDLLCPPFVVLRRRLRDVDNVVKAGGFFPIAVRIVDLAFEAGARPIAGLILCVKVDAAVGMGRGHDVNFEMKVFEWLVVADIEQMAAVTVSDERAVFDLPGVRAFLGFFPTVESLAIKELDEAFLGIGSEEKLRWREDDSGGKGEKQISFHPAENKGEKNLAQAIFNAGCI
jgi:hypothetical protein